MPFRSSRREFAQLSFINAIARPRWLGNIKIAIGEVERLGYFPATENT